MALTAVSLTFSSSKILMLAVLKGLRTLTRVDPPKEPWRSRVEGVTAAAAASSTPPGVLEAVIAAVEEGVLVEGMTIAGFEGVEGGWWWKFANGVGGDEGQKDILLNGGNGEETGLLYEKGRGLLVLGRSVIVTECSEEETIQKKKVQNQERCYHFNQFYDGA